MIAFSALFVSRSGKQNERMSVNEQDTYGDLSVVDVLSCATEDLKY